MLQITLFSLRVNTLVKKSRNSEAYPLRKRNRKASSVKDIGYSEAMKSASEERTE